MLDNGVQGGYSVTSDSARSPLRDDFYNKAPSPLFPLPSRERGRGEGRY